MKSLPFSRPCASRRVTIALDRPPDLTLDSTCLDRVPRSRSRLPACPYRFSCVRCGFSTSRVLVRRGPFGTATVRFPQSQTLLVYYSELLSRTTSGVGVAYTSDTSRDSGIDTYRAVHPTAYRSVHCHLARHAGMARAGTHDNPTGIADRDGGERSRTQTGHKTSDRSGGTFIPSLQSAVPQARSLLSSSQT